MGERSNPFVGAPYSVPVRLALRRWWPKDVALLCLRVGWVGGAAWCVDRMSVQVADGGAPVPFGRMLTEASERDPGSVPEDLRPLVSALSNRRRSR